jgi:tungstate transport system substrate-binding protein
MYTPAMRFPRVLLLALAAAVPAACGGPGAPPHIRLATTTSTEDSGLLDYLLPPFEKKEGVKVDRIAVGTGEALAIARRGDADIVLVHARAREDEFVAKGFGIDRRDVMWNDFLIAGPAEDPAGIAKAGDAEDAFRRIAAARAKFISRGDDSGTDTREKSIWQATGITPDWPGYKEAGQGMGACLTLADETRSYVLTDRGTYLAWKKRSDLQVLTQGGDALKNPYGVILVNPVKHPGVNVKGARKLLEYLVSPEGQERIAAFRVGGQVLFHPDARN